MPITDLGWVYEGNNFHHRGAPERGRYLWGKRFRAPHVFVNKKNSVLYIISDGSFKPTRKEYYVHPYN
jgi:hypothetical protein